MSDLTIYFQDENILVVEKPSGLITEPGRDPRRESVRTILEKQLGISLFCAHRLDKETSGILMLAKNRASCAKLGEEFSRHRVEKKYWAIVCGKVPQRFCVKNYLKPSEKKSHLAGALSKMQSCRSGGSLAETEFTRVEYNRGKNLSWVLAEPRTGRMHQLRCHLSELGFAILGDQLYGSNSRSNISPRLCLHAVEIKIEADRTEQSSRIFVSRAYASAWSMLESLS